MSFFKLKGDGDGESNKARFAQREQEEQDRLLQEAAAARERMVTKHNMMSPAGTRDFSSFNFTPVANASQGQPLGFGPTRYNRYNPQPQPQQSGPMPMLAPPPSSGTRVRAPTMGFDEPKSSSSSSSFADLLTPVGTTVVRPSGYGTGYGLGGKSHRRRAKKAKRSRKARRASRRSRRAARR